MIKTSCQYCSFYKDQSCNMGLYPKFEAAGKTIDFSEGFGIVGGVCLYRKENEWTAKQEDPVQANLDEPKTPVSYIVVYTGDMDALNVTLNSINNAYVVVAVEDAANNNDAVKIFKMLADSHLTSYNVVGVYAKDDFVKLFGEAFRRVKNGYCTIINAGYEIPEHWVSCLSKYVCYEQNMVLGVSPVDDINGLTVYSTVFRLLRGNKSEHYFAKLIEAGGENYIKTWDEICM